MAIAVMAKRTFAVKGKKSHSKHMGKHFSVQTVGYTLPVQTEGASKSTMSAKALLCVSSDPLLHRPHGQVPLYVCGIIILKTSSCLASQGPTCHHGCGNHTPEMTPRCLL